MPAPTLSLWRAEIHHTLAPGGMAPGEPVPYWNAHDVFQLGTWSHKREEIGVQYFDFMTQLKAKIEHFLHIGKIWKISHNLTYCDTKI